MKIYHECNSCKELKPYSDFTFPLKNGKRYRQHRCRSCTNARAREKYVRVKKEPASYRNRYLLTKYGISLDDYNFLLDRQGGVCAICMELPSGKILGVDHCHKTGVVRGLLCWPCNISIRHLRDDTTILKNAIIYLDEDKEQLQHSIKIARIISEEQFPKFVNKPWGSEHILAYNKYYCYKRITVRAGHATSLQLHEFKTETNHLESGNAIYHWVDSTGAKQSKQVGPGFFVTLSPGQIHRFEALTDIVLMEASSPHIWDVVRLEDSYKREGTSEP